MENNNSSNKTKSILDLEDDCIKYNIFEYCDDYKSKLSLILTSRKGFFNEGWDSSKVLVINGLRPEYRYIYKASIKINEIFNNGISTLHKNYGNDKKIEIKIADLYKEKINNENIDILNEALNALANKFKNKNGIEIIVLAEVLPLIKLNSFSNLKFLSVKSGVESESEKRSDAKLYNTYNNMYKKIRDYIKSENFSKNLNEQVIKQGFEFRFDGYNVAKSKNQPFSSFVEMIEHSCLDGRICSSNLFLGSN